jgi:hypothetical protein
MVSTVACGASLDEIDIMFGAKAVVSRLEIRRGCHVTVMESGKFLGNVSSCWWLCHAMQRILVFNNENVLLAADAKLQPALDQLFLAHFAQTIGIACCTVEISGCYWKHWDVACRTAAQAQYLDVIAVLWARQCQQSRRKEHGLIVGMRDQQKYALIL